MGEGPGRASLGGVALWPWAPSTPSLCGGCTETPAAATLIPMEVRGNASTILILRAPGKQSSRGAGIPEGTEECEVREGMFRHPTVAPAWKVG